MRFSARSRRALSTILALLLAIESVSAVAVAATTGTGRSEPVATILSGEVPVGQDGSPPATITAGDPATWTSAASASPTAVESATVDGRDARKLPAAVAHTLRAAESTRPALRSTKPKVAKVRPSSKLTSRVALPEKGAFSGANHVWIPALGISRTVHFFPCDRGRAPDNFLYRWGCSGTNNVYLMGHASSVMKALHDAYVRGGLRVGMKAYYADAQGKVRTYALKWWKLTRPTTSASWAWASQSVPSMTLQTCVGSHSQYRLMVRLVQVRD